jgi:hypothetical protein
MPYRADLESEVNGLEYDFDTRVGRLYVPRGAGADMEAAVALFMQIDPAVRKISTLAGLERSTVYDRDGDGHWEARRVGQRIKTTR